MDDPDFYQFMVNQGNWQERDFTKVPTEEVYQKYQYYLTLPETRKDLEQRMTDKFHHVPKYFEILFRVTGIDKTAYNTEILIFNEIKPDQQ